MTLVELLYLTLLAAVAILLSGLLAAVFNLSRSGTMLIALMLFFGIAVAFAGLAKRIDKPPRSAAPRKVAPEVYDDGGPLSDECRQVINAAVMELEPLASSAESYEALVTAYLQVERRFRPPVEACGGERYLDRLLAAKRCEAALRWGRSIEEIETLYEQVRRVGFPGGEDQKRNIDSARLEAHRTAVSGSKHSCETDSQLRDASERDAE